MRVCWTRAGAERSTRTARLYLKLFFLGVGAYGAVSGGLGRPCWLEQTLAYTKKSPYDRAILEYSLTDGVTFQTIL